MSPQLVVELAAFGHDFVHVRELGMSRSTDVEILELAHREGRVIVSSDTDFGELLACTTAPLPSVVLLRRQGERWAAQIVALLEANLEVVAQGLEAGAIACSKRSESGSVACPCAARRPSQRLEHLVYD